MLEAFGDGLGASPNPATTFSRHLAPFPVAPRVSWPAAERGLGPMRRGVRIAIDWGDARIGVAACDPRRWRIR